MASTARIDELKKKFDENPRRYFAPLANEFRKSGDIEQAIIICEEFLPQQPGHMSGHIVYGQALYEASRMPEAQTVFETALALDPENLIALRHLGDIARGQGEDAQARTWYVRVLDADPRNEEMQALIATLGGRDTTQPERPPAAGEAVTFEFQEEPPPAIELESRRDESSERDTQPAGMPVVPPPIPMGGATQSGATEIIDGFSIEGFEQPAQATTVMESHHAPAEGLESTSFTPPDESIPAADLDSTLDSGVVSFSAPTQQVESLSGLQGSGIDTHDDTAEGAATHEPLDLDDGLVLPPQGDPLAEQAQAAESLTDDADQPTDEFDVPTTELAALPSDADFDLAEPESEAARYDAPPVELPPAVIAAEGALIDAGETPAPEPAYDSSVDSSEPAETAAQAPFVTETMADLYLSQGYRDEARAVYVQLLAANPSDERLQTLVDSLATPVAAPGGPSVREFFSRIAARRPGSRAAALVPPADDDFATHEMAEVAHAEPAEDMPEQVPFSVAEAEGEAPEEREADTSAEAKQDGPIELPDVDFVDEQAAPTAELVAPAIERAAAMRTPTGSIDVLFGNRAPSTSEDSAASALAQAFGGTAESPALAGRPARAATAELSLDSVFRDGPARAPRTSQSFSFDQFFTGGAVASMQPTPSGGAPRASGEMPVPSDIPAERSAEDIEKFNSWLQGLKPK